MKIELRNVKINQAFSEETLMFKADIYVDGIKTAFAQNDGRGGSTFYHAYEGQRDLLLKAEKYANSLPSTICKDFGKPFEIKSDLEHIIDNLVYEISNKKEKEKHDKRMQKKMITCLLFGVPQASRFTEVNFRQPLANIPKETLQKYVDQYKVKFTEGQVFLNTNLEALGISL